MSAEPPVIALDCDGVLLDYSAGYGRVWELVLGEKVELKNVRA
jgi:hypothetical protein